MATRKAARVFPEPVGDAIRVSRPWAIRGQPPAWGSVGPSGKRRRNHSATAGWNGAVEAAMPALAVVSGARTIETMVGAPCDNLAGRGPPGCG